MFLYFLLGFSVWTCRSALVVKQEQNRGAAELCTSVPRPSLIPVDFYFILNLYHIIPLPLFSSSCKTMVAKGRKQSSKSTAATQADRDRSPLLVPPAAGKSTLRRAGREGKAATGSHPNGLSDIRHRLGLSPSVAVKLGFSLLLGKLVEL